MIDNKDCIHIDDIKCEYKVNSKDNCCPFLCKGFTAKKDTIDVIFERKIRKQDNKPIMSTKVIK